MWVVHSAVMLLMFLAVVSQLTPSLASMDRMACSAPL